MNQRKYERYRRQQQSEYGTGRRIFAIVLALLFFFGTIVLSMTSSMGASCTSLYQKLSTPISLARFKKAASGIEVTTMILIFG